MTVLTVTSDTGGTTKAVGSLYVPPDRAVLDAGVGTAVEGTGLDPAFTADLLSACLTHERCGVHLYRSVAGRTTNAELQARYVEFGEETLQHVQILEDLIASAGGNPQYVSPSARATEKAATGVLESTFLLAGSVDLATAELVMLEAVALAESKDHANWELLGQLAAAMADGPVKEATTAAVETVLAQEEEHYGWARTARAQMLYQGVEVRFLGAVALRGAGLGRGVAGWGCPLRSVGHRVGVLVRLAGARGRRWRWGQAVAASRAVIRSRL